MDIITYARRLGLQITDLV